jgi:hypothetical protein
VISELGVDIDAEMLVDFFEFAFHAPLLEALQRLNVDYTSFYKEFCGEILATGERFWLVLRSVFNHLVLMLTAKPHLLLGLEWLFIKLSTCRELRCLDSEIKLHKLEVLLPQVIPKKYENLPMEEISYQGAYIRALSLIIIEGIIKQHLIDVKEASS